MESRSLRIASLLFIPLFAFVVARSVQAIMESQVRIAIEEEIRLLPPEERAEAAATMASLSLRVVCADPQTTAALGAEPLCGRYGNLDRVAWLAVLAALVPLTLLGVVALAGRAARGDRRVLLRLFRPLLALMLLVVVLTVLLQGFLAVASFYYGEIALIGRVHIVFVGLIALGAAAGALAVALVLPGLFREIESMVYALPLSSKRAPELWRMVRQVARDVGTRPPDTILVGLEPTFFVTEVVVHSLDRRHEGRTLYLSVPLMRIMTQDELRGVIGHELRHFKGADTRYARHFYPIYRGASQSLEIVANRASDGWRGIALWPAVALLSFFLDAFATSETAITRQRELHADQEGAGVSGAEPFASALVKTHAYSAAWPPILHAMVTALAEGKQLRNASAAFQDLVVEKAGPGILQELDARQLPHPTDTHPPLSTRLEALGVTLFGVTKASLAVQPDESAIAFLPDCEKIEESLTDMQHQLLIQAGFGVADAEEPSLAA